MCLHETGASCVHPIMKLAARILALLVIATALPLGAAGCYVDSGPVYGRPGPPPPGYGRSYEWRHYR